MCARCVCARARARTHMCVRARVRRAGVRSLVLAHARVRAHSRVCVCARRMRLWPRECGRQREGACASAVARIALARRSAQGRATQNPRGGPVNALSVVGCFFLVHRSHNHFYGQISCHFNNINYSAAGSLTVRIHFAMGVKNAMVIFLFSKNNDNK